jgi:hypothetical protein
MREMLGSCHLRGIRGRIRSKTLGCYRAAGSTSITDPSTTSHEMLAGLANALRQGVIREFAVMATILERLRAEKEAQDEEEARRPICDIESARSLIADISPSPAENVTLKMCVLRIDEFEKNFRLELIEHELEQQCEAMQETIEALDVAHRSKFILLTIWKNRKAELNHLEFRRSFSYRFEKIHSLRLSYGNPVGSMQIRDRLRADQLPLPGFGVCTSGSDSLRSGADESDHMSGSNANLSTPAHEERKSAECELQQSKHEAPVIVIPVGKKAVKRSACKEDDKPQSSKRPRKGTGKSMCFESPRKMNCSEDAA